MRIVIIGAVAGGTAAAAKAGRDMREAEIVLYEKGGYISYAGCGMPYYIGGKAKSLTEIVPRDPAAFKRAYNADVLIRHEVLKVSPGEKSLSVKNLETGEVFSDRYDKLVLATGARAFRPPIKGADRPHVFTLRNIDDMNAIKDFIDTKKPPSAVIIGTGAIGLEMCENIRGLGMEVTLLEMLPQVTPGMDKEMADYIQRYIESKGVTVHTGAATAEIKEDSVVLSDGREVEARLVLLAAGVRPNTELAAEMGVELGIAGTIRVNSKMETNLPDVYACGDCCESLHMLTGKPVYSPLGSTASKTGRIVGENLAGGSAEYRGVMGTGIFRVFDLTVATTGLSQKQALEHGFDPVLCHDIKPDRPEYMLGKEMVIRAVADRASGRLLGAQIVGTQGVDKRIDIFATAITYGARAEDLFHLDLAYSPPYSTTRDPVAYAGMILDNMINRGKSQA